MITRELKLRLTTKQKNLLNQWLFNLTGVYNWECSACGAQHARDLNGARNIFVRSLGDSPSLKKLISSACVVNNC